MNETQIDNAHPKGCGIAYYPDNMPTDAERHVFLSKYLAKYYAKFLETDKSDFSEWMKEALPKFDLQVKKTMILNNFMWGVWCLLMVSEEDVLNEEVFNYFLAEKRLH